MIKRPKLAYHQRTAANNNDREETSSVVEYEYTARDNYHHVPNNVTHVRIHSSVIDIKDHSFYRCKSLEEVVLNEGLRRIGEFAFQDCTSLQSITLPSTLERIGRFAFNSCFYLNKVVLNEGVQRIGYRSFQNCRSLQSIVLPSTVTEIDKFAFWSCTNLREVVINNEDILIGNKAFSECTSLERFSFPSLSTRLTNIIQAGQTDIKAKMDDIPAVEWRDGELIIPAEHLYVVNPFVPAQNLVEADKEKLDKVVQLIRYYEIKEATTLFELALWKCKINQAVNDDEPANRKAYRIEVPGPVKDTILQYLR